MDNMREKIINKIDQIANQWQSVLLRLVRELDFVSLQTGQTIQNKLKQIDNIILRAEKEEERYIHYPLEELTDIINEMNDKIINDKLMILKKNSVESFDIFEKKISYVRQQLLSQLGDTEKVNVVTEKESYYKYENEESNPLLRPIHGISLREYASAVYCRSAGMDPESICDMLGITSTIWNEVNTLWTKRMEEDAGLTVITFYSRYYNEAEHNNLISEFNNESN